MNSLIPILVTAVVIVLVTTVLVIASFRKLTTEEAGMQYDTILRQLKGEVFTVGLHYGPPGYRFIKFPNVYRTIQFPEVNCLNKDGITVEITVQFQYLVSLKKEDFKKIILQFINHENFQEVIRQGAKAVIHDTCSEFIISQFQYERNEIQDKLLYNLNETLMKDFLTHVLDVQVSKYNLPEEYDQILREKETAKQNIDISLQERPRTLTSAETKLKEAQTQAFITINKAETAARITITRGKTEAEAILNAYETEGNTYKDIMKTQSLTVPGLLSYLTTRALEEAKEPININLETPAKTKY